MHLSADRHGELNCGCYNSHVPLGYVFCQGRVLASGHTDASRELSVWKVRSTLTCTFAGQKDVENSMHPWGFSIK